MKSIILNETGIALLANKTAKALVASIKYREFQKTTTPGYDFIFRDKRMMWNDVEVPWLIERCPYGKPGDSIYVKEIWTQYPVELIPEPCDFWYKAAYRNPPVCYHKTPPVDTTEGLYRWKAARFMPPEAARYIFSVGSVEVKNKSEIDSSILLNPKKLVDKYAWYWYVTVGTLLVKG